MTRTGRNVGLLLFAAVGGAASAGADAPLRPPHRYTECAPEARFCVTSDPATGTFAHPAGDETEVLWRIPKWFRTIYLAADPELLVTGFDGVNLVPLESPGEVEILAFWRRGELVRSYRLRELVTDLRSLERTASHFHWGRYQGFDADGHFRLETVEQRTLVFDARTGELLRRLHGDDRAPDRTRGEDSRRLRR